MGQFLMLLQRSCMSALPLKKRRLDKTRKKNELSQVKHLPKLAAIIWSSEPSCDNMFYLNMQQELGRIALFHSQIEKVLKFWIPRAKSEGNISLELWMKKLKPGTENRLHCYQMLLHSWDSIVRIIKAPNFENMWEGSHMKSQDLMILRSVGSGGSELSDCIRPNGPDSAGTH